MYITVYFSANDNAVLLASDVAARGLDIPNVEHVIHYQVPQTVEVSCRDYFIAVARQRQILSVLLTNQYLAYLHLNFCQNYVHRSGRTARAMKEGLSVMLISPDDVKNYRKIVHTLNRGWFHPTYPLCDLHLIHFQHLWKTLNKVFM